MSNKHIIIGTPSTSDEKTLVIMGAPRGGTSMVAGAYRELGVNLGERLGENHEDPQFLTQDLDLLRQRIEERNKQHAVWGWKMPHSTRYIDQLISDIRNPHLVFVFRNLLSTSVSQVNRSNSDILNALQFSLNQNIRMIELIKSLDVPTLLIDYDKAVSDKDHFIARLADFMRLAPSAAQLANCQQFIDPETGYKQVAATYYEFETINVDDYPNDYPLKRVNHHLMADPEKGVIKKTGNDPRIIYREKADNTPIASEFVVKFRNITEKPSHLRILLDFDGQFSQNMAFKDEVLPGISGIKIKTKGNLRRIAILPSFDANENSELVFFGTRSV